MAPIMPVLAQSESKTRFFERLGLNEQNEYHRRLYAMMKVSEHVQSPSELSSDLSLVNRKKRSKVDDE